MEGSESWGGWRYRWSLGCFFLLNVGWLIENRMEKLLVVSIGIRRFKNNTSTADQYGGGFISKLSPTVDG